MHVKSEIKGDLKDTKVNQKTNSLELISLTNWINCFSKLLKEEFIIKINTDRTRTEDICPVSIEKLEQALKGTKKESDLSWTRQ